MTRALIMKDVDLSELIRINYPSNRVSLAARKLLCGVGVNDADYLTQPVVDSKRMRCPAYQSWSSMIKRCYANPNGKKNRNYEGVTVCHEWLSFMEFRSWWVKNNVDGYALDKDLISNGTIYSPDTCVYVPQDINNFTIDCRSSRGEYKIGASFHISSGKFIGACRDHVTGKQKYLGLFIDPEIAHEAWRECKLSQALSLKPLMDGIDERIYPNVVEIINAAK